jgi:hypothetical protein
MNDIPCEGLGPEDAAPATAVRAIGPDGCPTSGDLTGSHYFPPGPIDMSAPPTSVERTNLADADSVASDQPPREGCWVLNYGPEELCRLADAAEAALGAVEAWRARAEVWGNRFGGGGWEGLDAILACQALDRAARELGMPDRCRGWNTWPKPELTNRVDPNIFKDISTLLAELAARGFRGGLLPEETMRRFRDLVRRLVEARDGPSTGSAAAGPTLPRDERRVEAEGDGGEEAPQPRWDRETRQLWFGKTLCLELRREAPDQFAVLGSFQSAGWPASVPNPFSSEKKFRDTIHYLNSRLSKESPIVFRVDNLRLAWDRRNPSP